MSEKQLMAQALQAYDAKSYNKAYEIWESMASKNADAMVNLGSLYAKGEGVAKDLFKASEWFEKAFAQGHTLAAFYLGGMYENGIGFKQDNEKAAECYAVAAEAEGFTTAQVKAALLHKESDVKAAMGWLIQAAYAGDEQAQGMITFVSNATQSEAENISFRQKSEADQRIQIREVVEKEVAPALAQDGGGIELVNYVAGETPQIWMRYLGACSGCHLGSTSTADMIINILEKAIDKKIVIYLW